MAHYIWIIFCLLFLQSNCKGYLNNIQWTYIRNILSNPNTPNDIRKKTQMVLVNHYYDWTINVLRQFRDDNKACLNAVMENELRQHAIKGLLKATTNYTGKGPFHQYSEKYVLESLFVGLHDATIETTITDRSDLEKISNLNVQLSEYKRRFYSVYDTYSIKKLRTIYYASRLVRYSGETGMSNMNIIKLYIRHRLKRMIF